MTFKADLEKLLGLKSVAYKANLSKTELFHGAIGNDRGRVRRDGPSPVKCSFRRMPISSAVLRAISPSRCPNTIMKPSAPSSSTSSAPNRISMNWRPISLIRASLTSQRSP